MLNSHHFIADRPVSRADKVSDLLRSAQTPEHLIYHATLILDKLVLDAASTGTSSDRHLFDA